MQALVLALALVMVGCKTSSGPGGGETLMVLPPEVGSRLEAIIKGEAVKNAVPKDWTIEAVEIQGRTIKVKLSGPQGGRATVLMKHPDDGGVAKGKWFAFSFEGEVEGLRALAEAIDKGFEESPWVPASRDRPKP